MSEIDKKFEIWCSGWASSDGGGSARLLATQKANSFDEAVKKYIESDKEAKKYMHFNEESKKWVYWGCSVFDNSEEAHKAF